MAKTSTAWSRHRLQNLAKFRYALRQFLHFSEGRAAEAGLHPQQHQLLLHLAGAPEGVETTVSYAAERLGLRHNSVVELSKRCEEAGLIRRKHGVSDRRRVVLQVTAEGQRVLRALSEDHERELVELVPRLIHSLTLIRNSQKHNKSGGQESATERGRRGR
ncbi:MarR family winged helix-turn-helix transcriptional regulator [Granulicella sp. S190]|uniref:MarR family winged helix-turn-helix transcriptional regulator n=1 Tax=Granulicella sp. S190 TaxID=1747226 RepID=UPI00131AEC9B|nr:MarR family winged helix-turn-helix transcriptional regulator [Granulicella sp. S190]